MAGTQKPSAEFEIDETLVSRLLRAQHPDLASLPLRFVTSGWDNTIFRLGDAYLVRLPRREVAAALIANEQRWLPELANRLPYPVPAPIRAGTPAEGYPWPWSIAPWFEGTTAAATPPSNLHRLATALADFLRALHQPAPDDAPENSYRGVPLERRAADFEDRTARLGTTIDQGAVASAWKAALATPRYDALPLWLHGDLHPANLVVRNGALAAVIDFGDLTAGDPASDLAVAWLAFDASSRATFRSALAEIDAATWDRARGWALHYAVMLLAHSADEPTLHQVGERALEAVLTDAA